MIRFKEFLTEALKLHQAIKHTRMSNNLYKSIYDKYFQGEYRIYADLEVSQSHPKDITIENIPNDLKFDDEDEDSPIYEILEQIESSEHDIAQELYFDKLEDKLIGLRNKIENMDESDKNYDAMQNALNSMEAVSELFNNGDFDTKFTINDYTAGICTFTITANMDAVGPTEVIIPKGKVLFNKQYRLGSFLQDMDGILVGRSQPTLLDVFKKDTSRSGDNLQVVVSRHPYDIAGMSTGRGWTSCMNLKDGCNRELVPQEVKAGTIVAYLISKNDKNINKPLSRVLIKPYVNSKGHTMLGVANTIYGSNKSKAFRQTVVKIVDEINNAILPSHIGGKFSFVGAYDDNDEGDILRIKNTKQLASAIIAGDASVNFYQFLTYDEDFGSETESGHARTRSVLQTRDSSEWTKRVYDTFKTSEIEKLLLFIIKNDPDLIKKSIIKFISHSDLENLEKYSERIFINYNELLKKAGYTFDDDGPEFDLASLDQINDDDNDDDDGGFGEDYAFEHDDDATWPRRNSVKTSVDILEIAKTYRDKFLSYIGSNALQHYYKNYMELFDIVPDDIDWKESKSKLEKTELDLATGLNYDSRRKRFLGKIKIQDLLDLISKKKKPLHPILMRWLLHKSNDSSISKQTQKKYRKIINLSVLPTFDNTTTKLVGYPTDSKILKVESENYKVSGAFGKYVKLLKT